jgi:hypothetical protein
MPTKKASRLNLRPRGLVAPRRKAPSKKLAISFDGRLATEVQKAAQKQAAGNVSAWLAEAARDRLRLEGGRQLLKEYEAKNGIITDEQIAEVEREWRPD